MFHSAQITYSSMHDVVKAISDNSTRPVRVILDGFWVQIPRVVAGVKIGCSKLAMANVIFLRALVCRNLCIQL